MPTIIDGSGSATFQTPLPLAQGGNGNTTGNVVSSQVAAAFNATGSAPLYACRAWVNFNGTGTVAIRASGNVSSITDNGTGDYTVNFTTAMVDANYSFATGYVGATGETRTVITNTGNPPLASNISIKYAQGGLNPADANLITLSFFR
jgi:hypothetical protein